MKNLEFIVSVHEMLTFLCIITFIGILNSKYYEKIKVEYGRMLSFLSGILLITILVTQLVAKDQNWLLVLTIQCCYHAVVIWQLCVLAEMQKTIKFKYERHRRFAAGALVCAVATEYAAALLTLAMLLS